MDRFKLLSEKQYEVMEILWKAERSLIVSEIWIETQSLEPVQVEKALSALIRKGYVGGQWDPHDPHKDMIMYRAVIPKEEYARYCLGKLSEMYDRKTLWELVRQVLGAGRREKDGCHEETSDDPA